MPLDSTATLTQIQNSYLDNASYAESASVAKARSFVTACRMLLLKIPKMTGSREANVTMNPELIQKEMQSAIEWLQAYDTGSDSISGGPRVRTVSFESFR